MKNISLIFKALGDPTRQEILKALRERDYTPTELLQMVDATQPTLSHHLDILKRAGLVEGIRKGQHIIYTLDMGVFEMALDYLRKLAGQGDRGNE